MTTPRARAWRITLRLLFAAFLIGVAVLLYRQARTLDWAEIGAAIVSSDPLTLSAAMLLSATSYLSYASFDLIGRRYVGHSVPVLRVLAIGATSYAFNLNIGALVGSAGFRLRLYSRSGVGPADIARIIALAISGNWSGYVLLAGLLLATRQVDLPPDWARGSNLLQGLGVTMLVVICAYPLVCAFSATRRWTFRGHAIELPSLQIALMQIGNSLINWFAIATTLWVLLPSVAYPQVLAAVLLSAVAGALAHIPAGIGVMEAVFVMLLSDRLPTSQIVAALLTYRAVYYLLPLLLAIALYFLLEHRARRTDASPADGSPQTKNKCPGSHRGPCHPDEG